MKNNLLSNFARKQIVLLDEKQLVVKLFEDKLFYYIKKQFVVKLFENKLFY